MDCDTQLAATCLFALIFFRRVILTSKVLHTDLVFGVQSGFISRSVHARLQVPVCSAYSLCQPVNIQRDTERQHLISLYEKLSQLS